MGWDAMPNLENLPQIAAEPVACGVPPSSLNLKRYGHQTRGQQGDQTGDSTETRDNGQHTDKRHGQLEDQTDRGQHGDHALLNAFGTACA